MSIEEREKNVHQSRTFRNIRQIFGLDKKAVLDIGCGFGEYLRLFGQGSAGITTTDNEIEYAKSRGLSVFFGNAEKISDLKIEKKFDVVWANNLFEHLLSPHAFLIKLKKVALPDTMAILGVPVVPKISSLIHLRGFRGTLATNHVSFFTHLTLRLTVERAGWKVREVRPFIFKNAFLDHLVRPFSPHVYVVAENDWDFVYPPKKVREWIADEYYGDLLSITGQR